MVDVTFCKKKKVETKNVSKDDLMKIFSTVKECIDVDFVGHSEEKIDGLDFLLNDGTFLSLGIGYNIMWGDCEHYIYFSVSDEDPREWKREMEEHYKKLGGCM